MVICPSAASALAHALAQDRAEAAPHITVHIGERGAVAVLEVSKPSLQRFVEPRDRGLQRDSARARGQLAHLVLEPVQRLAPRPAVAPLEVIPKEVKTSGLGRIHQAGFHGMQRQAVFAHPRLHAGQRGLRRCFAPTQQHEVVGVAHHLHAALGE